MSKTQPPSWLMSRFGRYFRAMKVSWITTASDDLRFFLLKQKIDNVEKLIKTNTLLMRIPVPPEDRLKHENCQKLYFLEQQEVYVQIEPRLFSEFRSLQNKILANNYVHNGQHQVTKYLKKGRLSAQERLIVQTLSHFCYLVKEGADIARFLRNNMPRRCIKNFKAKDRRKANSQKQEWRYRDVFKIQRRQLQRA